MSLDCQKDPCVPSAAVVQEGSGGLSGVLRGSAVKSCSCRQRRESPNVSDLTNKQGHIIEQRRTSLKMLLTFVSSYPSETVAVVVVFRSVVSVLLSVAG